MSLILSSGKQDILLQRPFLNSAGMLGFSDELRDRVDLDNLGAFITNPVSLHPRTPSHGKRMIKFTGGVLLHTGLPNPGLHRVIDTHRTRWRRMACPVILHLLADNAEEMTAMVDQLDGVNEIQAIEVGLLDENLPADLRVLEAACGSLLPVIARPPLGTRPENLHTFQQVGAAAIALGPPRGTLMHDGVFVSGRLYGNGLFPQLVHAVERLMSIIQCPVIAAAGIHSRAAAEHILAAGADAIELDTVLWTNPDSLLDPEIEFPSSRIDQ